MTPEKFYAQQAGHKLTGRKFHFIEDPERLAVGNAIEARQRRHDHTADIIAGLVVGLAIGLPLGMWIIWWLR